MSFTLHAQEIDSSSLTYIATEEQFQGIPIVATNAFDYLSTVQHIPGVSRFIFIRHGESTSNAEKSIAGRKLDVGLTEKGKTQAMDAAKKFEVTNVSIHAVYSSPSLRAKHTATLFHDRISPEIDERLYEKFYGPYEGASEEQYKPVKEAEETENSGPHKYFCDKFKFKAHPEMESMEDIYTRTKNFLLEKHAKHEGENVIIATHNGLLKALFLGTAAELGYDVDYRAFILGNASILVLEINDSSIKVKATTGLTFKKI